MIGDALEYGAKIRLGVDPVELARTDQAVHRRSAFAARVGTCEQIVLAPERNRT